MGRRKKPGFSKMKMLASRIEESDYYKFEEAFKNRDGKKLQEVLNAFVRCYVSGNLRMMGTRLEWWGAEDGSAE